jgi:hypothetical protein
MGTLQALMPNGAVVEREMSSPWRYSHGLVVQRGIDWVLVSVHTSQAMAHKNRRNLERCFVGGEAFGDFPIFEVVPVLQKTPSLSDNRSQPSTTVKSSAAA